MATPWDRAAEGYMTEWVPRFVPYHLDLVRELTLKPGHRVLVVSCGPGSEVLATARTVGDHGFVRATDKSAEMVRICTEQIHKAGFKTPIECAVADATDVTGGPWDAVLCAFGLWQMDLDTRAAALTAWAKTLAPQGKIGVMTWGPSEPEQPFEMLATHLHELEPDHVAPAAHVEAERELLAKMFETAGLEQVRHTVVRHTLNFTTAEAFVKSMREACTWRRIWEELGDARIEKVARRFYATVGGPDTPLTFRPPATLAIARLPGADVELEHLPSLRLQTVRPPS
jgi:cyclopropane fatty-acyl-phospholipid synthase-like methyltransferase